MRKRLYTRNVGVLLEEDTYEFLVDITDKFELTLSGYIRKLIEKEINNEEEVENEKRK